MSRRLLILCYHNVRATPFFSGVDGSASLERQLRLLRRVANVVRLGDALAALDAGERLPGRAVSVTFDDGYRDNVELALPLLERLGLPATFFLAPGILGRDATPWWERLAWALRHATTSCVAWAAGADPRRLPPGQVNELVTEVAPSLRRLTVREREQRVVELVAACAPDGEPDDAFLDWDSARAIVARGFEVGSHSESHLILGCAPVTVQRADLAASRDALERAFGIPIRLLAYPSGRHEDYNAETIAAAEAAGYTHASTTVFGWNSPTTPRFELRRVVVEPRRGTRGLVHPFRWARRAVLSEFAHRPPRPSAAPRSAEPYN